MKILAVIPSRIGSTRLPRKPLVDLAGKPMIQRVYEAAIQCPEIDQVIVATDSLEIQQIITSIGGSHSVEMTATHHITGSDRVAEVSARHPDYQVVINLQGDEPFIRPQMLTTLVQPFLEKKGCLMSTLGYPLDFSRNYTNPNCVKVIFDKKGDALYFSRSPLPFFRVTPDRVKTEVPLLHHMGLYAFDRDFLQIFTQLPQSPLELCESLEQLRALENGYKIRVCQTEHKTLEINTPDELKEAQQWAKTFFAS